MIYITQFFSMMLTALFIENIIFTRALGTSWMFYLVKRPKEILQYTLILSVVVTLSGLIGYPIRGLIHNAEERHVLVPIMYIGIMSLVYIAVYFFVKKVLPGKFEHFGMNLGVAVFNCATLGGLLVASNERLDLLSTLGYGIGMSLGFGFATLLLGYGLTRLEYCRVPKIFRGVPIALIYLGLLSLAFYGLVGHQLPT
jgi:electron transport complex protein RnfA